MVSEDAVFIAWLPTYDSAIVFVDDEFLSQNFTPKEKVRWSF